jgi:hypothetical protein
MCKYYLLTKIPLLPGNNAKNTSEYVCSNGI